MKCPFCNASSLNEISSRGDVLQSCLKCGASILNGIPFKSISQYGSWMIKGRLLESWYFTFGSSHLTIEGRSLENNYCLIKAPSEEQARMMMFMARGDKWSFDYPSADKAGVKRFNLVQVELKDITINSD